MRAQKPWELLLGPDTLLSGVGALCSSEAEQSSQLGLKQPLGALLSVLKGLPHLVSAHSQVPGLALTPTTQFIVAA